MGVFKDSGTSPGWRVVKPRVKEGAAVPPGDKRSHPFLVRRSAALSGAEQLPYTAHDSRSVIVTVFAAQRG